MRLPDAEVFDEIHVMLHEDDMGFWKVVGVVNDGLSIKTTPLREYIKSKALAEGFLTWYTTNYWSEVFGGPQDC